MKFDLVRPCPHCPFRTDIDGFLRPARAQEIARSLADQADFPCHKTVDYSPGDVDEGWEPTAGGQMCAGAMIVLERTGASTQMMRIAERTGAYDASRLDMSAPVCDDLSGFIEHHGGEIAEPCSVCDYGCLAPAGWMGGGGAVVSNYDIDPDDVGHCVLCGDSVCMECGPWDGDAEGQVCSYHGDEDGYQ